MQCFGASGEAVDVVLDDLVGQFVGAGGGLELRAEEDVLASPDEFLVGLFELVERDVPEPVDELVGQDQRVRVV